MNGCQPLAADCPSRVLFDQIAGRWPMMLPTTPDDGPPRFDAIRRLQGGVTQKAPVKALHARTLAHQAEVEAARRAFDGRSAA